MSPRIVIVPVWPVKKDYPLFAKKVIYQVFKLEAIISNQNINAKEVFDPFRNQYLASSILLKLNEHSYPPDIVKIIGLTDIDIFEPVFEYLFGEAQLGGTSAIVSTFRLQNKLYGIPENKEAFFNRLYKEIVHELGHTFNLIHCFAPMCVMNPSTYIEQIDAKSEEFCTSCKIELDKVLSSLRKS